MNRYFAFLNRRVAGVPVYVIAGILVVGLAYLAFRMKPSAATDSASAGQEDAADSGASTGDPMTVQNPIFTANPTPVQGADTSPTVQTNETWARRAIEWLIGRGTSEDAARIAIQQYLAGATLTASQNALKNAAVAQFGLPPDLPTGGGVDVPPAAPVNESPASRQGNPPLNHKVKNTRDNTFSEIARVYYGRTDSIAINLLRAGNSSRDVREPFAVGTSVYVPKWVTPRYYTATSATRTADAIARKNSTTGARVLALNYGKTFPVKVGTRVRVA